jgi:hypothetical integral membrane protein (TIGR02206 family)
LLAGIAAATLALVMLCRRRKAARRPVRLVLGWALLLNELGWWAFRYGHEGLHLQNLPLQLCDVTLWMTVFGCLTLSAPVVEFAYFAGIAGAGMALLTPDLWSPWPTYPAIYFFVAHGGIVAGAALLVFGGVAPLRKGAMWRAYAMLLGYAAALGVVNALSGSNFMYLCRKPANASPLDSLGPWPVYLLPAALLGLTLFYALWIAARPRAQASS